jgi:hypothetical protein
MSEPRSDVSGSKTSLRELDFNPPSQTGGLFFERGVARPFFFGSG